MLNTIIAGAALIFALGPLLLGLYAIIDRDEVEEAVDRRVRRWDAS